MTKILYIPTGRYLEYWLFNTEKYTCILEEVREKPQKELDYLTNIKETDLLEGWLAHNDITLPILLSELEVIYD